MSSTLWPRIHAERYDVERLRVLAAGVQASGFTGAATELETAAAHIEVLHRTVKRLRLKVPAMREQMCAVEHGSTV